MNILRIRGGAPLQGIVDVSGSKNSALAILASVPVSSGRIILKNVPEVSDVAIKLRLLERYGARIEREGSTVTLDCERFEHWEAEEETVHPIRTSFYLLGPLLARLGRAKLPAPGGCRIGARPVDFHIKGLRMMGVQVDLVQGCYVAACKDLKGAEIYLDFPSAGATQHLMATATLARGVTTIQNAAVEPEVVALAGFLGAMGSRIEGAGTSTITIHGKPELGGCAFRVPEDRLQAGTFLLGAAITRGDVTVRGAMPEHQTALVNKLREAGAFAEEGHDWVRVAVSRRLTGIRVRTMPYPGFPTDIQQPMAAALALAYGPSVIEETIYESRIGHVAELNRMGARLRLEGRSTLIDGVGRLQGAHVEASDLRAGAALVLAGLAAEGETVVRDVHFIDRGYERLEEHLTHLGARVERTVADEPEHSAERDVRTI